MFKSIIKWSIIGLVIVVGLGMIDLYTFELVVEDPGYYVVARHSDTPSQVLDALDKLKHNEELTQKKAGILVRRYEQKLADSEISKSKKKKWKRAFNESISIYKELKPSSPGTIESDT